MDIGGLGDDFFDELAMPNTKGLKFDDKLLNMLKESNKARGAFGSGRSG